MTELVIKLKADILSKLPKDNSTINGDFCSTIELSKPKTIIDKDYKNQFRLNYIYRIVNLIL